MKHTDTITPNASPRPQATDKDCIFELVKGSDIEPVKITWLWNGWLPCGKLVILAGQPGTGKTTLILSIAAITTTGGILPDGTTCAVGSVLIWSGEDGIDDTLVPRLKAMGANMEKVYFVSAKGKRIFDPSQDLPTLSAMLKEIPDIKLVIIDPVVSAINGDSHKNAEVRKGLQPLVDLGADTGACIVGISHFNKSGGNTSSPLDLLSGSIAFAAVARVVLGAAKLIFSDPEHGHLRIFCRIKSNIGPDEDGIGYDLRMEPLIDHPDMEASTVQWGQYVTGHSRDLLSQEQPEDGTRTDTKLTEAMQWLTEFLSGGPVESKVVTEQYEAAGHTKATIRRAEKKLKLVNYKEEGKGGRWKWRLPTAEESKPRPLPWLIGTIEGAQVSCSNSVTNEHEQHEQHEKHAQGNLLNLPNLLMLKREENMSNLPFQESFTETDLSIIESGGVESISDDEFDFDDELPL